jgi:glycosyltransferase involved in cell wall biosynthesis
MKNNSKKIAVLYSGSKGFGGIEKYLTELFSLSNERIKLTLISLGDWDLTQRFLKNNHDVKIFSGKRIDISTIKHISDYLKDEGFDLMVSQGVVSNAYARAISRTSKVPNLVTVHSNMPDEYPKFATRMIYKLIDKTSRFSTKKYIAVSEFLKKELIKSGIKTEKIEVIYNGLDFEEPCARQKRRLVIGGIGRLDQIKGFDILIDAFAMLKNKRLRLKIAGVGAELENLIKQANTLGLENRVEFVGFIDDVKKFLDSIDVYVQPSRSEGFGITVIEAMSRQLPVAVLPNGSLPEIVRDGENGLIAKSSSSKDLAKEISRLIEDYDFSKKIGEKARLEVIKKYDKASWHKKTVEVYLEACR